MAAEKPQPAAQPTTQERPSHEEKLSPDRSVLRTRRRVGRLRAPIPRWQALLLSVLCVVLALGIWWFLTSGQRGEDRLVSPTRLPSVGETFGSFHSLWFERALTRNTVASLRRVVLGFGLAAVVGVPLGILCGCFTRFDAFLAPLTIFGRNIPMAALIPLSFSLFGIDEWQKIMFIFVAAIAFIVSDTAQSIRDVDRRYIDTAYTLGASRRQVILKVLVPLSMPTVFNSLRLLFGLAFGYIMLAEVIQVGGVSGLGGIINNSFRRGPKEHIYLVLLIIPLVALAIDRLLFWTQQQLFPHRYGGSGLLAHAFRKLVHGWELLKGLFLKPVDISAVQFQTGTARVAAVGDGAGAAARSEGDSQSAGKES